MISEVTGIRNPKVTFRYGKYEENDIQKYCFQTLEEQKQQDEKSPPRPQPPVWSTGTTGRSFRSDDDFYETAEALLNEGELVFPTIDYIPKGAPFKAYVIFFASLLPVLKKVNKRNFENNEEYVKLLLKFLLMAPLALRVTSPKEKGNHFFDLTQRINCMKEGVYFREMFEEAVTLHGKGSFRTLNKSEKQHFSEYEKNSFSLSTGEEEDMFGEEKVDYKADTSTERRVEKHMKKGQVSRAVSKLNASIGIGSFDELMIKAYKKKLPVAKDIVFQIYQVLILMHQLLKSVWRHC